MKANITGRFGHHPDPATDFCIEVEAIEGLHRDVLAGHAVSSQLEMRLRRALAFNVGGSADAVEAKTALRKTAEHLKAISRTGIDFSSLVQVIRDCAAKFREYEALHRAKGTIDGDVKAAANATMAQRCEDALVAIEPPAIVKSGGSPTGQTEEHRAEVVRRVRALEAECADVECLREEACRPFDEKLSLLRDVLDAIVYEADDVVRGRCEVCGKVLFFGDLGHSYADDSGIVECAEHAPSWKEELAAVTGPDDFEDPADYGPFVARCQALIDAGKGDEKNVWEM